MADILVPLLFVIFSIGFVAMCIRHVSVSSAQTRILGAITRTPPPQTPGIDPEVINAFPVVKYSDIKDVKIGDGSLECAVCLTEFGEGDSLRLLPKCDHAFHPQCIDKWLTNHVTCPVCRMSLVPETEATVDTSGTNGSENVQEVGDGPSHQVSIRIDDDHGTTSTKFLLLGASPTHQTSREGKQRAMPATRKLRRSHSTGHSLVFFCEALDKYTLRLPEDVRKQIESRHELKRTENNEAVLSNGEKSSRNDENENRMRRLSRFDRLSKSDRWLTIAVQHKTQCKC